MNTFSNGEFAQSCGRPGNECADPKSAKPEQIIIQVKRGKTRVKDVRDLRGVLGREKAAIGILISLQPASGPIVTEAARTGFYEHKTNKQMFPRLQLRVVKELMDDEGIERPTSVAALEETFKKAPRAKARSREQSALGLLQCVGANWGAGLSALEGSLDIPFVKSTVCCPNRRRKRSASRPGRIQLNSGELIPTRFRLKRG